MNHYLSFIVAILTIPYRATIAERVRLSTISMPTIYHSRAWHEFQVLSIASFHLVLDIERFRQ
jgi:hypothetical protein